MDDISMNEMKEYLNNKREDTIKSITKFVNSYPFDEYISIKQKQIIVEFISVHQLIEDKKVKDHLITEISKKCDGLFVCKLHQINEKHQQHLIKQYVKTHYSYLNFRERFPLN
jgi:hypothetical protein